MKSTDKNRELESRTRLLYTFPSVLVQVHGATQSTTMSISTQSNHNEFFQQRRFRRDILTWQPDGRDGSSSLSLCWGSKHGWLVRPSPLKPTAPRQTYRSNLIQEMRVHSWAVRDAVGVSLTREGGGVSLIRGGGGAEEGHAEPTRSYLGQDAIVVQKSMMCTQISHRGKITHSLLESDCGCVLQLLRFMLQSP